MNIVLDPKFLSQIKLDLHEIFRGAFCGCPMMIKTKKNKSINKQTNKHTNIQFLDPKYLSQIKMDLHKTFRETSCWCPKITQTKKNKSINKQTNKIFLKSKISQQNQVRYSQNIQGNFLWAFYDD